jgi:general secretion pathway protein F
MQVRLRVLGPDARPRFLDLEAVSHAEAIRQALARGARVLAIEPLARVDDKRSGRGRVFPLLLFSQELLALLEAGLNLTQALETLFAKEMQSAVKQLLGNILQGLREGRSFSETLAQHTNDFPDVYVATVRAAERTGDLPRALSRYIAYQLQLESVRKRLISASIYPVMLLVAGGFVLLFLLGYVVPKFSVVYESAGRELPWMSAMLLGVGKVIYGHWVICATALAALVALAAYMATRSAARQRVLAQVLRVPLLARRVNEFRLARFYRAVSLLLAAGIPLTRALAMVGGLLNEQQQRALAVAREQVEAGQPLSVALVAHGLAAPVAESLIKIGESTGRLADMLERTAAFQDEDFSRWVDWTSRLLEPVLMMLIGLVIGAVVVLMYIPIFELAGGLQ